MAVTFRRRYRREIAALLAQPPSAEEPFGARLLCYRVAAGLDRR